MAQLPISPAACTQRKKLPDICKRGDMVKNRWRVKLGAGTFGQVYKVQDQKTGKHWALKVESKAARKPVLRMDVAIARALNGKRHAAEFFACGYEENFAFMITQLLGRNLATRKRASQEDRFPLRTVVRIGLQGLAAIRDLHEAGFLHRDIKPSNLAIGVGPYEKYIYLLDFGLARKYLDDKGRIYPPREKANFRGTIRYASPKAHRQQELGRGDDLWSLVYTMIELGIGHLPWRNLREIKEVGIAKVTTPVEKLCFGLPESWKRMHEYCKDLGYQDVPDYGFVERCINGIGAGATNGIVDMKQVLTDAWEWDAAATTETHSDTFAPI